MPVAAAKRAGSRFCHTGPAAASDPSSRYPDVGRAIRPLTVTAPAGGARDGQRGARRALRDPAAVDQHDAPVREAQRRDDVIADAAVVHPVVDEDLPRAHRIRRRRSPGESAAPTSPTRRAASPARAAAAVPRRRTARAAPPCRACGPAASGRRRRTARPRRASRASAARAAGTAAASRQLSCRARLASVAGFFYTAFAESVANA